MTKMKSWRAFFSATFFAAGLFGLAAAFATPVVISAGVLGSAVTVSRTFALIEIGGSLAAGLFAALRSQQRKL